MTEPIKLPPLTGMLADLPERHKEVIEVYGKACAIAALQSQDRGDVATLKAGLEEAAQTMRAVLAQERLKAVAKRCLSRAIVVCDRAIDRARRGEGKK